MEQRNPRSRRHGRSGRGPRAARALAVLAAASLGAACAAPHGGHGGTAYGHPGQRGAWDARDAASRQAVPAILVGQSSDILTFENMPLGTTLTYDRINRIDAFVLGAGKARPEALHVSIVGGDGMPFDAVARVLIEAGVPPDNVTAYNGGERLAHGQMRLLASLYDARRPTCGPTRRRADPETAGPLPELGCVQNASLAAMVADPLDLIGRPDARAPIDRIERHRGAVDDGPVDPVHYK